MLSISQLSSASASLKASLKLDMAHVCAFSIALGLVWARVLFTIIEWERQSEWELRTEMWRRKTSKQKCIIISFLLSALWLLVLYQRQSWIYWPALYGNYVFQLWNLSGPSGTETNSWLKRVTTVPGTAWLWCNTSHGTVSENRKFNLNIHDACSEIAVVELIKLLLLWAHSGNNNLTLCTTRTM